MYYYCFNCIMMGFRLFFSSDDHFWILWYADLHMCMCGSEWGDGGRAMFEQWAIGVSMNECVWSELSNCNV